MTSKTNLVLTSTTGSYSRVMILSTNCWTSWLALVPKWLSSGVLNIDVVLPTMRHHNTYGLTRQAQVSWHRSNYMPACASLTSLLETVHLWTQVLVICDTTVDHLPLLQPWLPWASLAHVIVTLPGSCHLCRLTHLTPLTWDKIDHPFVGGCTTASVWVGTTLQRYHRTPVYPQYCYTAI